MTKKLITLALAALMLLSLAAPAMADDGDFVIINGALNRYTGAGGDVVIPSGVTKILHGFSSRTDITSVTIPSGVTEIGDYAFRGCTGLTSVTIPEGVTDIGEGAFDSCTGLKSVYIPASIKGFSTGSNFSGCTSLTDVYFGGTEEQWESFERVTMYPILLDMYGAGGGKVTMHYNSSEPAPTTPTTPEPTPTTPETPTTPTTPEQPTAPTAPEVQLSNQPLTVDGKAVSAQAYNIGGSNFFKLRDVAMMLNGTSAQFSVGYDAATRTVTATSGEAYTASGGELTAGEDQSASCVAGNQPIYVNGVKLDVTVYNIGGSNYFMLRDLGQALGFGVDYDAATRTVLVTTK